MWQIQTVAVFAHDRFRWHPVSSIGADFAHEVMYLKKKKKKAPYHVEVTSADCRCFTSLAQINLHSYKLQVLSLRSAELSTQTKLSKTTTTTTFKSHINWKAQLFLIPRMCTRTWWSIGITFTLFALLCRNIFRYDQILQPQTCGFACRLLVPADPLHKTHAVFW